MPRTPLGMHTPDPLLRCALCARCPRTKPSSRRRGRGTRNSLGSDRKGERGDACCCAGGHSTAFACTQHAQDPGVVETACTALCNALLCDEARERLGTLGGRPLKVTASAIASHLGDAALVDQAVLALRAILLHGRAGPADAAGAVPVFLELLRASADSASRRAAVSVACAPTPCVATLPSNPPLPCLFQVAGLVEQFVQEPSSVDAVVSGGGCELLLGLLDGAGAAAAPVATSAPFFVVTASASLKVLARAALRDSSKAAGRMSGGLSKIIAALLVLSPDAQAAASGCALLGLLAALPSSRVELEAAAEPIARALTAVFRAHEPGVRDARVALEEACSALAAVLAAVPAVGDRFLEVGGTAPLVRLVALPEADVSFLVSCACRAVGRVAARPSTSSSDCAADASTVLLESLCADATTSLLAALRHHAARPHVVAEAASALASVSQHAAGCTAFVAAGPAGAKCLMDALVGPIAESAAVLDAAAATVGTREASRALAVLTHHDGCCAALSAAGAQETLLRALTTTGSHDAAFFKAASAALANITAAGAAAAASSAAAAAAAGPNADSAAPPTAPLPSVSVLPLAEALRGHVHDADVASDVCSVVHNIAIAGGRTQVVASSLVADICAALRAHVAHASLALAACRALRFLSATRSALPPAAAADAATALVAALESHGGDARSSVAKAACAALRNLAWGGGRRTQVEIALAGGVEALLGALAVANTAPQGRTARVIASQACRALACVAAAGPDVAEGLALSGGVATLVGALGAHGADVDVARAALRALGHAVVGGGSEAGPAIVACGGLPTIAAALRAHPTALPVLRAGASALRTLAGLSPDLAAAAESAGVPATLKGALGISAGSAEKTQANDAEFLAVLELLQRRAQEQEPAVAAAQ